MPKARNKRVTFSAEQRKAYKTKAQRIDRDEKPAILAKARRVKARAELMRGLVQSLKAQRERSGLSLTDLSARSGIDKAALSRLENAANINPQIDTLLRYAEAIGAQLTIEVKPAA